MSNLRCIPLLLSAFLTSSLAWANVTIRVVDEHGQPIERFDAVVHAAPYGQNHWSNEKGTNGELSLYPSTVSRLEEAAAVNLLICAEGYAPAMLQFTGEAKQELLDGQATITMERGRKVRLQLRLPAGVRLPSGLRPQVYFPEFASHARGNWRGNERRSRPKGVIVRSAGDGEFVFHLPTERREFLVGVHHPGWLRFWEAGPFSIDDFVNDRLRLDVPRPASTEATFDLAEFDIAQLPFDRIKFDLSWRIPGTEGAIIPFLSEGQSAAGARLQVDDLAPGVYNLSLVTVTEDGDRPRRAGEVDPARFWDRRKLKLRSGQTESVQFAYVPFQPDAFHGDRTAQIKVLAQDGSPAQGKDFKVTYFDGHYGYLTVHEGIVPDDGVVRLEQITDRVPETVGQAGHDPYTVQVDGKRVGWFRFKSNDAIEDFEFRLAPRVGDRSPDIEIVDLQSQKTVRLSDFRGKIVFVEFWATWCGPCQKPMDKLNELVATHGDEWQEEVVILPIGIDDNQEILISHVEQRGWTKLPHYWSGGEETGFQSQAVNAYAIPGVPTALLINREGRIVWRGHPGSFDLAARITELLMDPSGK